MASSLTSGFINSLLNKINPGIQSANELLLFHLNHFANEVLISYQLRIYVAHLGNSNFSNFAEERLFYAQFPAEKASPAQYPT